MIVVSCTKLIKKDWNWGLSWFRICQICKWVAILTFGLRPGLQRHLADIKCIQNTLQTDNLLTMQCSWWTNRCAECIYFKDSGIENGYLASFPSSFLFLFCIFVSCYHFLMLFSSSNLKTISWSHFSFLAGCCHSLCSKLPLFFIIYYYIWFKFSCRLLSFSPQQAATRDSLEPGLARAVVLPPPLGFSSSFGIVCNFKIFRNMLSRFSSVLIVVFYPGPWQWNGPWAAQPQLPAAQNTGNSNFFCKNILSTSEYVWQQGLSNTSHLSYDCQKT